MTEEMKECIDKIDNKKVISQKTQNLLKDGESFFIDLRPTDSFHTSHIPGSHSFPAEIIYGMLARFSQEVPLKAKIVLYGTDEGDTSPSEVASLLQMMGYGSIYIMTDGWGGWEPKKENLLNNQTENP